MEIFRVVSLNTKLTATLWLGFRITLHGDKLQNEMYFMESLIIAFDITRIFLKNCPQETRLSDRQN